MQREDKEINWVETMEKFSDHRGKIVGFCKENNISSQQLYRKRKKLNQVSTRTFHAIDISKAAGAYRYGKEIKIEIGNTKIYIPKGDKATLIYILNELSNMC